PLGRSPECRRPVLAVRERGPPRQERRERGHDRTDWYLPPLRPSHAAPPPFRGSKRRAVLRPRWNGSGTRFGGRRMRRLREGRFENRPSPQEHGSFRENGVWLSVRKWRWPVRERWAVLEPPY